jgi:hypothetical protein
LYHSTPGRKMIHKDLKRPASESPTTDEMGSTIREPIGALLTCIAIAYVLLSSTRRYSASIWIVREARARARSGVLSLPQQRDLAETALLGREVAHNDQ